MTLLNVILSAKVWLTVSLAVIMSLSTVTPDIHPVEPDEVICQDSTEAANLLSDERPDQPAKAPHDHHAHNCGSCHFHATPTQMTAFETGFQGQLDYNPKYYNSPSDRGPTGLYRPPRA